MLTLKNVEVLTVGRVKFWYEVTCVDDKTGMVLKEELCLVANDPNFYVDPKVVCSMEIPGCKSDSVEGALDKMAEWCERLAAGIRDRKRALSVFT